MSSIRKRLIGKSFFFTPTISPHFIFLVPPLSMTHVSTCMMESSHKQVLCNGVVACRYLSGWVHALSFSLSHTHALTNTLSYAHHDDDKWSRKNLELNTWSQNFYLFSQSPNFEKIQCVLIRILIRVIDEPNSMIHTMKVRNGRSKYVKKVRLAALKFVHKNVNYMFAECSGLQIRTLFDFWNICNRSKT